MGSLVVFPADQILHEVSEASGSGGMMRFALTVWCIGDYDLDGEFADELDVLRAGRL